MGKKCIPNSGICFETTTWVLLAIVLFLLFQYKQEITTVVKNFVVMPSSSRDRGDVLNDPYFPPLNDTRLREPLYQLEGHPDYGYRRRPMSVVTQPFASDFSQIGILTQGQESSAASHPTILPLFGRQIYARRDKWQYYTVSNTGHISSKLPIRVKGRDALTEYGVDELMSGESVFVQGYNDNFAATVYDTRSVSYMPVYL
jgi:hypothetical protein